MSESLAEVPSTRLQTPLGKILIENACRRIHRSVRVLVFCLFVSFLNKNFPKILEHCQVRKLHYLKVAYPLSESVSDMVATHLPEAHDFQPGFKLSVT